MSKIRWEHLAFAVVAVFVALLDGGAIPDGPWHKAAEHLVALAGLAGIYVGRPLRAGRSDGLALPDSRPGAASGPLLALVGIGTLFASGCNWGPIEHGEWFEWMVAVGVSAILVRMLRDAWAASRSSLVGAVLVVCCGLGACTALERARIREGLITTSIGAVNCATPGLQAGIQAAVVQLLGSAVSGRGAGTAEEWRALGRELAKDPRTAAAAHCAADVVAKELAKLAAPVASPTVASAAPVVGFVQPQASGTRAQSSGGALGMEASSGGSYSGRALAGSVALRDDEPAGRARAAALWLSGHHGEW
jgi:hypothetical protein